MFRALKPAREALNFDFLEPREDNDVRKNRTRKGNLGVSKTRIGKRNVVLAE